MVVRMIFGKSIKSQLLQNKMSEPQYDRNFTYKNIFPTNIRYLVVNCGYTSRIADKDSISKFYNCIYSNPNINIITIEDTIYDISLYDFSKIDKSCKIYKTQYEANKLSKNVIFSYIKNGKKIHDKIRRHMKLADLGSCDILIEFIEKDGDLNDCIEIVSTIEDFEHCTGLSATCIMNMDLLTIDGDSVLVMEFNTII